MLPPRISKLFPPEDRSHDDGCLPCLFVFFHLRRVRNLRPDEVCTCRCVPSIIKLVLERQAESAVPLVPQYVWVGPNRGRLPRPLCSTPTAVEFPGQAVMRRAERFSGNAFKIERGCGGILMLCMAAVV